MIETYLGTILFGFVLSYISFLSSFKITKKIQYLHDKTKTDFGNYLSSVTVFFFISAISFLLMSVIYNDLALPLCLKNSGLGFLLLEITTGIFIIYLHKLFFWSICKITRCKTYYHLKPEEIKITWLLICIIYSVVFLCYKYYEFSFMYLTIFLSYFFWFGADSQTIKVELKRIRSLSFSYVAVLLIIFLCGIAVWRYNNDLQRYLFIAGTAISIIIFFFPQCKKQVQKKNN